MKKVIYRLNIGRKYAPDIVRLTYPLIERYAEKIDADIYDITERRFPDWDMDYEKLQIYALSKELKADWNIYIDSDAVVHPELPDITELIPRDTVAHNGSDFSLIRWKSNDYFRRDGRNIGSCNWLAVGSSWCRDLWRPLDDMTFEEAVSQIGLTVEEEQGGVRDADYKGNPISYYPPVVTREHLVSDYALSCNIARFGLKFTTLNELWKTLGLSQANFFYHEYTCPTDEKVVKIKEILKKWRLS